MKEEKLEASNLTIKDENNIDRLVISSKLPDPRIDGKVYPRDVKISGIQILDGNGDEIGGIGVVDQQRAVVFGLDYKNHEAVVVYAYDNGNEHGAGISINSKDVDAKIDGVKRYSKILIKAENGCTGISFIGKDGSEKMVLGLDNSDNPYIKIKDKNNKLVDIVDLILNK